MVQEWQYEEKDRPQHSIDEFGRIRMQGEELVENLVTWVYEEGSYVPVAKIHNGERYTIISDYMGRPVEAYNSYGNVVWQADYDVYGDLRNIKGIRDFIPFRQLGQYEDDETRLYYNRFRYYDPRIGNYISQDPIRLAGNNPTLYGYVADSNSWLDLFGLSGRGGTIHRSIQDQLEKDLGNLGKNVETEGQIILKNGRSRFGDVVVRNDIGDIIEVHQIGDMRSRGGFRPSSRERGAIMDIREALGDDVRIVFHDKEQRVTLIDPDKADNWKEPSKRYRYSGCS